MIPDTETVTEVTRSIWEAMLGKFISTTSTSGPPHLWMGVDIKGAFEGSVVLGMNEDLSRELAAAMTGLDIGGLTSTDALETMAELTNMVGGNLKGVMQGPNSLSIPRPASEAEAAAGTQHYFLCEGRTFVVSVIPRGAS